MEFINRILTDEITVADCIAFWGISVAFIIFAIFCNKEQIDGRESDEPRLHVIVPERDSSELSDPSL